MYSIQPYNATYFEQWNDFVARSKNGTFLFDRDFMEYHADRFTDYSLMVFEGTKLVALLPANRVEGEVHSHQGLTYGGLVLCENLGVEKVEIIFHYILKYLNSNCITVLKVKQIVPIYNLQPSFETDYILFKLGAKLYRRDMNLAINLNGAYAISKSKMKHFRRVTNLGLEIKQDNDFETFWQKVLEPRLYEKYNTKPVHNKEEIMLLHNKFPNAILQYNVYYDGEIVCGITLFVFNGVVKSQYGATTITGERLRALDYLFITLIDKYKDSMTYFDMGTVTDNNGKTYNSGLLKQKEELGCSVFNQDCYEVPVENYALLNSLI